MSEYIHSSIDSCGGATKDAEEFVAATKDGLIVYDASQIEESGESRDASETPSCWYFPSSEETGFPVITATSH